MNITTIRIDLAKTSFSMVGTDKHGKIVLRKTAPAANCPTAYDCYEAFCALSNTALISSLIAWLEIIIVQVLKIIVSKTTASAIARIECGSSGNKYTNWPVFRILVIPIATNSISPFMQ